MAIREVRPCVAPFGGAPGTTPRSSVSRRPPAAAWRSSSRKRRRPTRTNRSSAAGQAWAWAGRLLPRLQGGSSRLGAQRRRPNGSGRGRGPPLTREGSMLERRSFLGAGGAALAGIAARGGARAQGPSGGGPVRIATVGPMTGQQAALGAQMKAGAEQAVADLNAAGGVLGRQIALEIGDDACDPRQAVSVANQLAGRGSASSPAISAPAPPSRRARSTARKACCRSARPPPTRASPRGRLEHLPRLRP